MQSWLFGILSDSKVVGAKALHALVSNMTAVDGMTILSEWTEVRAPPSISSTANFAKISKNSAAASLPPGAKFNQVVAFANLPNLLGGVDLLAYYKAIWLSCEKRSLLTDLELIKLLGQGGFGRCDHCGISRVMYFKPAP